MRSEKMSSEAWNFVGCLGNAANAACIAISGSASYMTDYVTAINTTCGSFVQVNATALVLTASALMDGITVWVGGQANAVVSNPAEYAQNITKLAYCGHETLKPFVNSAFDTSSALIGAGATLGTGVALTIGTIGFLACRRRQKNRASVYTDTRDQEVFHSEKGSGSDGETDRLFIPNPSKSGYQNV
jgi:sugar (pentulose or hexulose) kinase